MGESLKDKAVRYLTYFALALIVVVGALMMYPDYRRSESLKKQNAELRERIESRKREIEHLCNKINSEFPECATCEIKDQYYNMREKIEPVMNIIDIAKQAMENAGVTPKVQPIRGGTDGAQLSFKNLPCPNIFAGGMNMHGRFEYVPIPSMEKAMMTIVEICKLVAEK